MKLLQQAANNTVIAKAAVLDMMSKHVDSMPSQHSESLNKDRTCSARTQRRALQSYLKRLAKKK